MREPLGSWGYTAFLIAMTAFLAGFVLGELWR
jgi:hypothetical protein